MSQVVSGGLVFFGELTLCLVGMGAKFLIDKFRQEPQLPASLEFSTTPVDTYSQLLTQYLVKNPAMINNKHLNEIELPDNKLQRYKFAKHIFKGNHGLPQDIDLGQALLNEAPKPSL